MKTRAPSPPSQWPRGWSGQVADIVSRDEFGDFDFELE
jgi:hypothetical protein